MPYKKTYRKKYRKRRYRKNRKYAVSRPLGRNHTFTRGMFLGSITASVLSQTFGSYSFKLSDLPDYAEFTNLFDEYMISYVSVLFLPVAISQASTTSYPDGWFILAVDKDDDSAPTQYQTLMQYPGYRIGSYLKQHRISFRPRFSIAIYNGVTNAYGTRTGFIDCSNGSVPHYGLKYGIGIAGTSNSVKYDVWVKYKIICRGVR